jgi:phospholipid/cholesterol/gamma-HCH transport system substrate-binding protein
MPLRKLTVSMKISIEAKVGLIGIATLVVLIWGINYLKGRNILKSTYTLYAHYQNSGGLESSAPVLMNGIKIGYVESIDLEPEEVPPVQIALHIEKDYPLRAGSKAILFSADLLGSKAIRIEASNQDTYLHDQDTLVSVLEPDLLTTIGDKAMPVLQEIGQLAASLDSLAGNMNDLLGSEAAHSSLEHISDIAGSLQSALEPGGSLYESFSNLASFSSMLASQEDEIASMTTHLNAVSEALDSAGIDKLTQELVATTGEFRLLLEQLNSGEGSAGKLLYSDTLYYHLENLVANLDSLVLDLNENPRKYVHFSLFGKSKE